MVAAWAIPELRRRIAFIFAMFGVYVFGLHIPLPGVNPQALSRVFGGGGGGILNLVDVFSGGALRKVTIFAMGIIPYINASIIMQLLTFAIPQWQELAKEGESGRKRIAQYTRYLTAGLALAQAIGLVFYLRHSGVIAASFLIGLTTVLTLVAGTAFLMWIGELITEKGIGNGVSLIIFCGIMVRLPAQTYGVYQGVVGGTVAPWQALLLVVAFFATVIGVIFVQLGQRKIPIQHVRKIVGNKMTQGGTSYLPFRVASAGVIPIIFALSIQLLPLTFAQFVPQTSRAGIILNELANWFSPGKNPITGLVYAAIIVFFTYFYTAVTVNVEDITDQLRKYGSYIPGIRPGKPTMEYLDRVLTRITLAGALFLALIALLQYWIPAITNTMGANQFTLVGGTSLLIVVGVALDTMQAIEAQLLMRNYEGFIR
ncbi:MAG: preprotein translocase subunit SecY [Armatimonadetes bacterium]|nr:preprotein translocase subunit SecY [Armatimonadota bacterium]